jgi:hypothetical protein
MMEGRKMSQEFQLTIEALQRDLAAIEQKAADKKATINRLCEFAGESPIYPTKQEPLEGKTNAGSRN